MLYKKRSEDYKIRRIQNIGLKVLVLVTDMGKNYQNMTKRLGITSEKPYFEIDGERIHYLADPPHLIKATRNNAYINDIKYNNDQISWDYIVTLYNYDKKQHSRLAYKLTDVHVQPSGFERMKVKYAVQTLSATVAAALNTLHVLNILPESSLATVEFIQKFDSLFDMFNSSTVTNKKSYKQAFTGTQQQLQFLQKMFDYISALKVVKKNGKDITNTVQVFKFWKFNIKSLQSLWIHIQNSLPDMQFLLTRRLNQDALENFFGQIRTLNGAAYIVTPAQFYFGFRKLFSSLYVTTGTGNCAEDRDVMIMNVNNYKAENLHTTLNKQDKGKPNLVDDHDYRNMNLPEQNAIRYVCGYLMQKCIKKHSCDICLKYAREYVDLNNNSYYCFFRAYETTENNLFGSLLMSPDDFVTCIKILENKFFQNIETLILQKDVVANLVELFSHVPFEHPCSNFPKKYIIKLFARVRLFFTLRQINSTFKTQRGHRKVIILKH